jgi:limonene-1,2-epoxide hydrolase
MAVSAVQRLSQWLVDGNEAVAGVDELGVLEAVGAVVPVWTVQALVANTVYELIAAIADGVVTNVPARVAQEISEGGKNGLGRSRLEGMSRVVTVLVADMASEAKVVVFARNAGDKLLLREDLDAAVTGAGWLLFVCDGLLLIGEGTRNLLLLGLLGLDLGCDALGGAVDDAAVLDETLNHPVSASGAVNTVVYAGRAEIVIAAIAYAAVEVLVLHGLVAVVAVHDP